MLAQKLEDLGVEVVDVAELNAAPASPSILGVSSYSARDLAAALEDCCSPSIADWDYESTFDYLPASVIAQVPLFASAPRQVPSWENYKRALWVCIGLQDSFAGTDYVPSD
jgi:hypothetical protein